MARGREELSTRLALEQAQKSAEALFETKSIADIKKVRSANCAESVIIVFVLYILCMLWLVCDE
jgi:hypothetical protein